MMMVLFRILRVILVLCSSIFVQRIYECKASSSSSSLKDKTTDYDLLTESGRIIVGAVSGDVSSIRIGIDEGGDVNTIMQPYFADLVLMLGRPYVDYPICPVIHLAFNYGTLAHLHAASVLYMNGANVHRYELPSMDAKDLFNRGYPPSIMFALGLGQQPTIQHAGFLQRFYRTHPNAFNINKTNEWIEASGNPPLLQITVLLDNIYGLNVLLSELKVSINGHDQFGVTTLHSAAWMGDVNMISMCIQYGADLNAMDRYRRTPLYYAIMRGHYHAAAFLLSSTGYNITDGTTRGKLESQRLLFTAADATGVDLFRLVLESPLPLDLRKYVLGHAALLHVTAEHYEAYEQRCHRSYNDLLLHTADSTSEQPDNVIINSCQRNDDSHCDDDHRHNNAVGWLNSLQWEDVFINLTYLAKHSKYKRNDDLACIADTLPLISIVDAASITAPMFVDAYYSRQRPALITNDATVGSNMWAYYAKSDFVHRYGSLVGYVLHRNHSRCRSVYRRVTPDSRDDESRADSDSDGCCILDDPSSSAMNVSFDALETMTLQNFLRVYTGSINSHNGNRNRDHSDGGDGNRDSNQIYFNDDQWMAVLHEQDDPIAQDLLLSDIIIPPIFRICDQRGSTAFMNPDEALKLFVGSQYSGINYFETHNSSWNLLIAGTKIWFLASPGMDLNITAVNKEIQATPSSRRHLLAVDWLHFITSLLVENGIISYVIQNIGDVLFIPHDWQYLYINIGETAMIQQQFCTTIHSDARIQPLGFTIYGGEDKHRGLGMHKVHVRSLSAISRLVDTPLTGVPKFSL